MVRITTTTTQAMMNVSSAVGHSMHSAPLITTSYRFPARLKALHPFGGTPVQSALVEHCAQSVRIV